MEQIKNFVNDWLDRARKSQDVKFQNHLFTQAFGAVEFAARLNPQLEEEIGDWWNYEMREKFLELLEG